MTTVAGDTVTGELVVARAETLILAREGVGVESLPLASIRTLEVDRSRVRSWTRPGYCLFAGMGIAATAIAVDEAGWSSSTLLNLGVFALAAWECFDTRPDWTPARLDHEDGARRFGRD